MMRSSQKSGRGRGKNNNNNRNKSSTNRDSHSPNRVYESAGPEGKVRGTPQQIIDKYQALARDYQLSGDRVMAENFLQHSEHYTRILVAAQEAQAERQAQQQANQPQQNNGGGQPQQGSQPQQGGQPQQGSQPQQGGQNGAPDAGFNADQSGARPQQTSVQQAPDVVETVPAEQPPADGLGAIVAAQGGAPDIVETPESAAKEPKPVRPRRPRPKPKAVKPPAEDAAPAVPAAPAATEAD